MRNYMPKVGSYGLDMMFRTCTVQVHFLSLVVTNLLYYLPVDVERSKLSLSMF